MLRSQAQHQPQQHKKIARLCGEVRAMEKQAKIIDTIVIITDFALFFKQFF